MPKASQHSVHNRDRNLDPYYPAPNIQYANISNPPQQSISYYQPSKYGEPLAPPLAPTSMTSYDDTTLYATGGPVQQPHVRSHYNPFSNPMPLRASSGAWNPQGDLVLMQARAQGMNWQPIQEAYFPSKTSNACRKRHERLMERRSGEDWDGAKTEKNAHAYMQLRREIWQPLANATGEKWNIVEQRCMSSGLKNLQAAARSYARGKRMLDASGLYNDAASHPDDLSLSDFPSSDDTGEGSSYPPPPEEPSHMQQSSVQNPNAAQNRDMRFVPPGNNGNGGIEGSGGSGREERVGVQNALAQFGATGRLPSMDMGIEAIINQPSGR